MTKCYTLLAALVLVCGTAYGQAQPRLIINEFLADPGSDVATGDANGDGVRDAQLDEFVELANVSADTLDLTGWRVGDDERVNFTFPDGYRLPPRQFVVIFGGGDVSNVTGYDADPLQTRVFSSPDSVGNGLANGGETIVILSPDGAEDLYVSYGSRAGAGAPTGGELADVEFEFGYDVAVAAAEDVAVTRSPDGSLADDPWVKHTDVSSAPFSPGTTVGGATVIPKALPPLTVIINEILADPSTDAVLGDANRDGERSAGGDEFVELANVGDEAVDLSGWTLGDDENNVTFTFPQGYILEPREIVVVFGGGSVENVPGYDADPLQTRAFVVDSLHLGIGNGLANGGDIVMLLSADGSYDTYLAYGGLTGQEGPAEGTYPAGTDFEVGYDVAAPANADNAITRFPDGNTNVIDPFVQHLTVSDQPFSPGTTIDGRDRIPAPTPPVTVVVNELLVNADADANGDGTVDTEADQFVELVNTSETEAVDLSGWQVGDAGGLTFTFPAGYTLAPQAFVAVFGGGDVSSLPGYNADPLATRVFAASGTLGDGLDRAGDYVVLVSADGSYDSYVAFGDRNGAGDPDVAGQDEVEWEFPVNTAASAGAGVSVTRDPDGNFLAPDPFVPHDAVSELAFSPAQTTAGLDDLDDFVDVPHPWGTGHALHFRRFERDRVEIRNAAQELPLQIQEGTIELWFRPDSILTDNTHGPDWTYLVGKNVAGARDPGDLGIAWPRANGNLMVYINDEQGNQDEVFSSDNEREVWYPRWYHLAVTWGQDSLRLFIDGELRASAPSTMPLLSGDQLLVLGNGSENGLNSSYEGFHGMIDEVRISLNERYTENFETPTEPFELDEYTLALWHFDEGSGDVAANAVAENYLTGFLGGNAADGNPDPLSQPAWVDVATLVGTEGSGPVPERFTLDQNYPNPFNPVTTIQYTVPRTADVEVGVYNLLGQRVALLVDQHHQPGSYQVAFDGSQLASGVYFYVLRTAQTHLVRKMVLLK